MKLSWPLLLVLLGMFVFSSCEKEVNIPLGLTDPKLVIEGSIASDQQPLVILTNSIGFFDKIAFDNVEFITNADVWVADLTAGKRIQLFPLQVGDFVIYTINNNDPEFASFETGFFEHAYQLEVTHEGSLYTAVSKIPSCNGFDSLYFEAAPAIGANLFGLKASFTDPDTTGNFYKYFTQRNGNGTAETQFFESFASRFDDAFINGKTLKADLFLGFENSDTVGNQFENELTYSKVGDTIIVKLSALDAGAYNFWKTLEFAEGSIGNPFASPIQVQTNITNSDAFGVWTAFGNHYDTIIHKP